MKRCTPLFNCISDSLGDLRELAPHVIRVTGADELIVAERLTRCPFGVALGNPTRVPVSLIVISPLDSGVSSPPLATRPEVASYRTFRQIRSNAHHSSTKKEDDNDD
ncbi:MAG: hypothetical protein HKL85_13180 [Acidimicrobiaceae bacterium]|nr:hypothetical protein [Acidimicrobiaceae bacterium]